MLYKRAFRKEKEVTTFLIKVKTIKPAWNLIIERRPYQRAGNPVGFSQRAGGMLRPHWHRQYLGSGAMTKIPF